MEHAVDRADDEDGGKVDIQYEKDTDDDEELVIDVRWSDWGSGEEDDIDDENCAEP